MGAQNTALPDPTDERYVGHYSPARGGYLQQGSLGVVPAMTGSAIAHADLVAAIASAAAFGGNVLLPPGSTTTLAGDVALPRPVRLVCGYGRASIVSDGTQRHIDVTGGTGTSGDWNHLIAGITFSGVAVRYGQASSDWGNGAVLRDCEFYGSDVAVRYTHNCWDTLIEACRIHNNTVAGVYFDFTTAVSNSGANMRIVDSDLFNHSTAGAAGLYVNGITTDGFQIQCARVDFDHNQHSVRAVGSGDGVIDLDDCHFELGSGDYINADSAKIFVRGVWAFDLQAGATAHVVATGTAQVFYESGRVQITAASPFLSAPSGTPKVFVDPDRVVSNNPFFAGVGATLVGVYAGTPVVGLACPLGYVAGSTHSTLALATASQNVARIGAYDTGTYELLLEVDISAVGGTNSVTVYYNPGGVTTVALAMPNVTGHLTIRIVWNSTTARLWWTFTPKVAGNAVGGYTSTAIPQAIGSDKVLSIGLGPTGNETAAVGDVIHRRVA